MENKKGWNKIFFQDFQTLILAKKKEMKKKEKKGKKGRAQFIFNYHTPSHEPNNSIIYFLIIRSNISSYG